MPYTQDELEAMTRTQLQTVCKGYGFKANDSTSKIIHNILAKDADALEYQSKKQTRRSSKAQATEPASELSSRRVTRGSDTSAQSRRVTRSEVQASRRASNRLKEQMQQSSTSQQPFLESRRKSKITQTSLGVGRPKAAGGAGARAVTRTATVPKRHAKNNGNVSNIAEEEEDRIESPEQSEVEHVSESSSHPPQVSEPPNTATWPLTPAATPTVDSSHHDDSSDHQGELSQAGPSVDRFAPLLRVREDVASLSSAYRAMKHQVDQINALQTEVRDLKAVVSLTTSPQAELAKLRVEVQAFSGARQEVQTLRQEVALLREELRRSVGYNSATQRPFHPPQGNKRILSVESLTPADMVLQNMVGTPAQVLGKRHRDSDASSLLHSPMYAGLNGQLSGTSNANNIFGSPRKKIRGVGYPEQDEDITSGPSPIRARCHDDEMGSESYINEGKPVDFGALFDFEAAAKDGNPNAEGLNTMLGAPPLNANLDFLSHTPTPLPFPLTAEAPRQSSANAPSRSGQPSTVHEHQRQVSSAFRHSPYKRNHAATGIRQISQPSDAFDVNLFGDSELSASKPTSLHRNTDSSVGINPAQLLGTNPFDVTKTPAAARTLYGTELDGDTRFGEYGIDGIAKAFWKAPGFPY